MFCIKQPGKVQIEREMLALTWNRAQKDEGDWLTFSPPSYQVVCSPPFQKGKFEKFY